MINRFSVLDRARGLPTNPYRDNRGQWVFWDDVEPYLKSLRAALDFLVEVGLEPAEILQDSQMRDYYKLSSMEQQRKGLVKSSART